SSRGSNRQRSTGSATYRSTGCARVAIQGRRVYDVKGSFSAGGLREFLDAQMNALDDWTRGDTPGAGDDWRFVDESGGIWTSRIHVEMDAETNGLRVRFAIQRASRG
ncbi:MAG: hypothetical protein O7A63_08160, partial [Acidobacteria bacterium]|nr:hypothetical protein [Acidobacteriota bacterium]